MPPRHKLEIKALGMDWCAARVFLTLNYSFALSSKWGSNVVDHKKNLILGLVVVIQSRLSGGPAASKSRYNRLSFLLEVPGS